MDESNQLLEQVTKLRDEVEKLVTELKRNQFINQRRVGLGATDLHNGFNALIEAVTNADK
jgi:ribosomal protein L17